MASEAAILFFTLATVTLIAGCGALVLLLRKHRGIWAELFRLRSEMRSLRANLVDVHKEAIRAGICEGRLPILLPSQGGEDVALWKFFGRKREGFFVEVGAYDGITFSNTYFFEAIGWSGILIEPMPEQFELCCSRRPYSHSVHAALAADDCEDNITLHIASGQSGAGLETLSFVGDNAAQRERIYRASGTLREVSVPCRSLNQILKNHSGPIDFVSIDVEGFELQVLQGFDVNRYRPDVIVVEDNSGGRDTRVSAWLERCDYIESHRCEHNVFFTRRGDARSFG